MTTGECAALWRFYDAIMAFRDIDEDPTAQLVRLLNEELSAAQDAIVPYLADRMVREDQRDKQEHREEDRRD